MNLPTLENVINDTFSPPAVHLGTQMADVNTGEALGPQQSSNAMQLELALASAWDNHQSGRWASLPGSKRAEYLDAVAEELDKHQAEIAWADAAQTGVILSLTQLFAKVCSMAFRQGADLARNHPDQREMQGQFSPILIERLPLGVAAIIAPWNAPSGIACHKLASALAAGCPVIFKPSEWAPASAQYIANAIAAAKLPAGTFQLVHGDASIGKALVEDKRVAAVSFTGGALGGSAVGASCGAQIKPVQLELGGNNAMLVLDDADLNKVADNIVTGLTTMNAQWCRALGRVIVPKHLRDSLLSLALSKLKDIKMGSSLDPDSQMGPLVHKGHLAHISDAVETYRALGAAIHQVTKLPELSGWFYPPTLITGLEGEQCLEEIFGPVATVHTYEDIKDGIRLANQTEYGLAAYVFGSEANAWPIARQLRAGGVKINKVTLFNLSHEAPRPAWGKSGLGEEGHIETFEFFRGTRVVGVAG